jgi:hypothetical protein
MGGFVLLMISVAMGIMLAFHPSYRLIAFINVSIFAVAVSTNVAAGDGFFYSAFFALLYLIVISGCFVGTSLLVDALGEDTAKQDTTTFARLSKLIWDGKNDRPKGKSNKP